MSFERDLSAGPADGPVWAVVLAAGRGHRFGGPQPKQYALIGDERVIDRSLATARAAADHVVVVLAEGEEDEGAALVASGAADVAVTGGAERADSVRAGLAVVDPDAAVVVVHDAARPLASAALHRAVVQAVHDGADAVIPAVPVTDTIKRTAPGPAGHDTEGLTVVTETLDRAELVAVQTPQAFRPDVLRRAHGSGATATDDAGLVEAVGATVVVVPGETTNIKITGPHDLALAVALVDVLAVP
ncbi:MAG: 2-C-methyl-D-erythritol 4-phosphate cytidylyltransferase [Acidimicrobiales bacterium]|jgi:2-C-methyl-D-erythritol 4-phosphate cytidylyltransferase|nr:2-C-methyl-D-erythritol 4-phosphate cytidylyltransferase [Acidimicrobiales bacterium]